MSKEIDILDKWKIVEHEDGISLNSLEGKGGVFVEDDYASNSIAASMLNYLLRDLLESEGIDKPVDPHHNPNCDHNHGSTPSWDYVTCDGCGWVLQSKVDGVSSTREWWPSTHHCEHFRKHGTYLDYL